MCELELVVICPNVFGLLCTRNTRVAKSVSLVLQPWPVYSPKLSFLHSVLESRCAGVKLRFVCYLLAAVWFG